MIGRNDLCPCGSGKKYKKCCMDVKKDATFLSSPPEDGITFAIPGNKPSAEEIEKLTSAYQENIRNSPIWDQMVKEFGEEKAKELLKEFKAKVE
jgi:hypothetical protein